MAIIKQYHKDTDTTYVYESTSYWDESKKQSRSKRRLIGKVDPLTGETVPTGKRGRKKKEQPVPGVEGLGDAAIEELMGEIQGLQSALQEKTALVSKLEAENQALRNIIAKVSGHLTQASQLCGQASQEGR